MMDTNDSKFSEDVIEKSKEIPVVVDFWAPWCGPCLRLGPILEKLEKEYKKFILAKVNVDDSPDISKTYRIQAIPCVKLFKNGKVADEFVGALPEENIRRWLNQNLDD